FVERAQELDALRALLALAESGEGGRVALIGGEAGAGKTRLARELAHTAAEEGALVLYGAAPAGGDGAYEPFVEALEFLVRLADPAALREIVGSDGADLARLAPGLGPTTEPPATDPETARRRLHNAVAALFTRVGRSQPVLLVVDDVHW